MGKRVLFECKKVSKHKHHDKKSKSSSSASKSSRSSSSSGSKSSRSTSKSGSTRATSVTSLSTDATRLPSTAPVSGISGDVSYETNRLGLGGFTLTKRSVDMLMVNRPKKYTSILPPYIIDRR